MNWIDHMDIVRILLENGIDVNAANDKGSGALHAAAGIGIFNHPMFSRQCFNNINEAIWMNYNLRYTVNLTKSATIMCFSFVLSIESAPTRAHIKLAECTNNSLILMFFFLKQEMKISYECWLKKELMLILPINKDRLRYIRRLSKVTSLKIHFVRSFWMIPSSRSLRNLTRIPSIKWIAFPFRLIVRQRWFSLELLIN